ncbi:peptidase M23B [Rhodospirillum rubrum F11]|uniref:Peptidase M23B n=3 Tax=Rhodospirillum rubrum TaxID=1085 RepID=Q2RX37_RHORT|nr:M23 family metallopeptidase [Rhodospirillum rubrum]ABC21308.1 Peptidase M23B [Rhodospirillum rubrum ATCC 11170]AEO46987.1 peptidase M23B [Rhodospirillum rubrum F11]QXG80990.1 M23 family metallopeptidase [Rhodospirillum rubrum]
MTSSPLLGLALAAALVVPTLASAAAKVPPLPPSTPTAKGVGVEPAPLKKGPVVKTLAVKDVATQKDFVVRPGDNFWDLVTRAGVDNNDRAALVDSFNAQKDRPRLDRDDTVSLTWSKEAKPRLLMAKVICAGQKPLTLVLDKTGRFKASRAASSPALAMPTPQPAAQPAALAAAPVVPPAAGKPARMMAATAAPPPPPPRPSPVAAAPSLADATRTAAVIAPRPAPPKDTLHRFVSANSSFGRLKLTQVVARGGLPAPAHKPAPALAPERATPSYTGNTMALAAPLPGARITSTWGWRIHPVLNRPQFHKGVDFGAPTGTPVLAAADGWVLSTGYQGNYGKLVTVQHNAHVTTAYAHLDGYAKDARPGSRVRKGQIIGYVGETGLATGPHLYYEVFVDGRQVDPRQPTIALPFRTARSD